MVLNGITRTLFIYLTLIILLYNFTINFKFNFNLNCVMLPEQLKVIIIIEFSKISNNLKLKTKVALIIIIT